MYVRENAVYRHRAAQNMKRMGYEPAICVYARGLARKFFHARGVKLRIVKVHIMPWF